MSREKEYKLTLAHIIEWLGGDGFDMWKPVSADFANKIRDVCIGVVYDGLTLEQAIGEYGDNTNKQLKKETK